MATRPPQGMARATTARSDAPCLRDYGVNSPSTYDDPMLHRSNAEDAVWKHSRVGLLQGRTPVVGRHRAHCRSALAGGCPLAGGDGILLSLLARGAPAQAASRRALARTSMSVPISTMIDAVVTQPAPEIRISSRGIRNTALTAPTRRQAWRRPPRTKRLRAEAGRFRLSPVSRRSAARRWRGASHRRA
jgi:hypothetical protein